MNSKTIKLLSFLLLFFPVSLWSTELVLTPTNNGPFTIQYNTLPIVSAKYIGWSANRKWTARIETNHSEPGKLLFQGKIKNLDTLFSGSAVKTNNTLHWSYQWNMEKEYPNAIGYGVEFNFNLNIPGVNQTAAPKLLNWNKGWKWELANGQSIKVEFNPPLKSIYFDRDNKNKLRAIVNNDIKPAKITTSMTITLPEESKIYSSTFGQHQLPEPKNWISNIIEWKDSPVDLSFLNKSEIPAGKHGFLKTRGESLIFSDGTTARFWGTNIIAKTIFSTSKNNVRLHAKRLSKLGFNLARIHHHDSHWVRPNIFGNNKKDTRELDETMLKQIDWWIKCLKDEGIYVWIDLHVGRKFTALDGIINFKEIEKFENITQGKGFIYFNPDLEQRLKNFNQTYLNHVSPYTKLALKDEPAVAAILITNENDITHHFGNKLLPNKNVPAHNKRYMSAASNFSRLHGLPKSKTWRSWEQGPSKLFLNEMEHQFNLRMIAHLRLLGVKIPIVTTNYWGYEPLSSLPALSDGDMIDVHSYGGPGELETNPIYRANMLSWISAAHLTGQPLSVTEWNVAPFPITDRYVIPLYLAGISSLQGWDALMQYGYSKDPLNSAGKPSNWQLFNDPGLIATMPAAALLYRQHHVKEALNTYILKPDVDTLYNTKVDPRSSSTIRTLVEKSKLMISLPKTKELPWIKYVMTPENTKIIRNVNQNFINQNESGIKSDTGELHRDWKEGIYTVNSDKSMVISGWIGGKTIRMGKTSFNIKTPHAVVAVQSMDNEPITASNNILISLSARSIPQKHNKLPFYSEPVRGTIKISAPKGLKLFKLDSHDVPTILHVDYVNNAYIIHLDSTLKTYWLRLMGSNIKSN